MKRIDGLAALALIACIGIGFHATPAYAYPAHLRMFRSLYGQRVTCDVCHNHGAGSERNAYGRAWTEAGENMRAFHAIDTQDADGDGASNQEEINAGSNPGDATSTPDSPGNPWQDADRITIPVEQLELVFERFDAIGAVEVDLSEADLQRINQEANTTLHDEDRFPTLYFSLRRDERQAVATFQHIRTASATYSLLVAFTPDTRIQRVALFRGGNEQPQEWLPYFLCIRNQPVSEIHEPGTGDCPESPAGDAVGRAIAGGIRAALVTARMVIEREEAEAEADASAEAETEAAETDDGGPPEVVTATDASDETLDLGTVPITYEVAVMSPGKAQALAFACIALLLLLITGSTFLTVRTLNAPAAQPLRLNELSGPLKLLCAMVVISLLLVQLIAMTDAYVQTHIVHDSTHAYFDYLSFARLLGISHSHVFGFVILYGTFGFLVCLTDTRDVIKAALVATMLWCGIFDVISWWGIKYLSASFDTLTMITGSSVGTASLISAILIFRSLSSPPPNKETAPPSSSPSS